MTDKPTTPKKPINETPINETPIMNAGEQLARNAAYAGKPGQLYIAAFLPRLGHSQGDPGWLAERIDDGSLIACPRCHFVHLPALPLPLGLRASDPPPVDACDVCAFVPAAAEFDVAYQDFAETLASAPDELEEAWEARAVLFYDLWVGAATGAELWLHAQMQRVLTKSIALARQPSLAAQESDTG